MPALRTRLGLLLGLALCAGVQALAQPLFSLRPEQQIGITGEIRCLEIVVDDFTDLLSFDYDVAFDPAVLQYNSVRNLVLPGLTPASFTQAVPGSGEVSVSWTAPRAGLGIGEDFPDFQPIGEVCFELIGPYGSSSPVAIADQPAPVVTRESSGGRNIGLFKEDGLIAVGVLPLHVMVGTGGNVQGGTACVDVSARQFTDIVSFQFSLGWDPAKLRFQNVSDFNPGLPSFTAANFNATTAGQLGVGWPVGGGTGPETLPDSAKLFTICFEVLAPCDESVAVELTETPTPFDVYNASSGQAIGLTTSDGQVDVYGCGNGLRLTGAVRTAAPGATVCIPFTVSGFQNIEEFDFDVTWNTGVLQFTEARVAPGTLIRFGVGDIDVSQAASGSVNVSWDFVPQSIPNGRVLFELCFTVVGGFGTNGVIVPDANGTVVQTGTNIGLNPRPGEVVILPSQPLTISLPTVTAFPGDRVCLPVTTRDFDGLSVTRYTILYEETVLRFVETRAYNLPNLGAGNFTQSPGAISLDWWSTTGIDRGDGETLYEVCFDVIGAAGACSGLELGDTPAPFVEARQTQGYDIGLTWEAGEVCTADTELAEAFIGTVTGASGSEVCVPVTLSGYDDMLEWTFSLDIDEANFRYTRAEVVGFAAASDLRLDVRVDAATGNLEVTTRTQTPFSMSDGVGFRLCFEVIGSGGGCSPIEEASVPTPNSATSSSVTAAQGGYVAIEAGELCAQAGINATEQHTDASCPGVADGTILVTPTGGSGSYVYRWDDASTLNQPNRSGLPAGTYRVTVLDAANPSLRAELVIVIGTTGTAPSVDGGGDVTLACDAGPLNDLDASATDLSGGSTANWRVIQGGASIFSGAQTLMPTIFGTGTLELAVTNAAGCVGRDTVVLQRASAPTVVVVQQNDLPCGGGTATLEVQALPQNGSYTFAWTTPDGAISGAANQATIVVTAAGSYTVVVREAGGSCEETTTLEVREDTGTAIADAGDDARVGCGTDAVTLGGTATTGGAGYDLSWSTPDGALLGPTTSPTVQATQPGRYFLEVIERANGCAAIDSVDVVSAGDPPNVTAPDTLTLSCNGGAVDVTGSGDSGTDFRVEWATRDGVIAGGSANSYTVSVSASGTYVLTVTNVQTGCADSARTVVVDQVAGPTFQLPAVTQTPCGTTPPLQDAAFATDSTGYRFAWIDGAGDTLSRNTTLRGYAAGTYTLVATDVQSGCAYRAATTVELGALPEVLATADANALTCARDTVVLDLTTSTGVGPDFAVTWDGAAATPVPGQRLRYWITAPGSYRPVATSADGSCGDTLDVAVVVDDRRTVLPVDAGTDLTLDCQTSDVQASAAAPGDPAWDIRWVGLDGGTVEAPTVLAGGFRAAGRYELRFTDPITGCTGADTLRVEDLSEDLGLSLGPDLGLGCGAGEVTVTATLATTSQHLAFAWQLVDDGSPLSPADPRTLRLSEPGRYALAVRDTLTGCTAADTVTVAADGIAFSLSQRTSSPDCPGELGTAAVQVVGGDPGSVYGYTWRDAAGNVLPALSSDSVALAPGRYEVLVTDAAGCADSIAVLVQEVNLPLGATATAMPDACAPEAELRADLPDGVTGAWLLSGGDGFVVDSTAAVTTLVGEPAGTYSLGFVSSTDLCAAYDTSYLTVELASDRLALSPDAYALRFGIGDTSLAVLDNDDTPATSTVRVTDGPDWVTVGADGTLAVWAGEVDPGAYLVSYEVCDSTCLAPSCEETTVELLLLAEETDVVEIPNAITPNGDGRNDVFVIDAIARAPQDFPTSRLMVFNRWGDLLFDAQPYANDWGGEGPGGEVLPQGTYYYVLELDLARQLTYQGHVTVLR